MISCDVVRMHSGCGAAVLLALGFATVSAAAPLFDGQLRFATTYGNHMVLQRAPSQAVVWGYCGAAGCDKVTVTVEATSLAHRSAPLQVGATPGGPPGTWIAKLPPAVGSTTPHTITATDGVASATLTDVLFGDVWVCSGQSNMAFLLENAFNGSAFVNDADNHPHIRMFTSKKTNSHSPIFEQPVVEEPWAVSSRASVSDDGCPKCNMSNPNLRTGDDNWLYMSAVCYLFGVQVQKHTGMPVGLVNTNWGGTPVEFWMSSDAEAECPNPQPAGGAYNGMVKPLLNMTIFGAIWYQGEANQGDQFSVQDQQGLPMVSYGCRFPAMIRDWRKKWYEGSMGATNPEFPFGFVSLAPWVNPNNGPAAVRWGQTAGYGHVPNPAMPSVFDAIAIDLTDRSSPFGSVHIRDKLTVAQRLSLGGIAVAYNDSDVYWQGPTVLSASVTHEEGGTTVTVNFANSGEDGIALVNDTGFEICVIPAVMTAGAGNCSLTSVATIGAPPGNWSTAKATGFTSNSVTITTQSTPANQNTFDGTVLVRYGWDSLPFEFKQASVYSKTEQLPAGPFIIKSH